MSAEEQHRRARLAEAAAAAQTLDPARTYGGCSSIRRYDLFEETHGEVPQVPGSLAEALDALEADRAFLLEGGVFGEELIRAWIDYKRANEVDTVRLRPHPAEFSLYFDC